MGYDIYLRWPDQTKEERGAQRLGFAVSGQAGSLGYLREAFHGSIYATQHFVWEAHLAEDGHFRAGGKERLAADFDVMAEYVREREKAKEPAIPRTKIFFGDRPDYSPDPRVYLAEDVDEDGEPYRVTAYPSEVLRERLPLAYAVASYRGATVYETEDGFPEMVEAFLGFTQLAERLESADRGPAMVYVS